MPYAYRMRKTLTARAGDWLARNSWPKTTAFFAYAIAIAAAFASSGAMLDVGVRWMAVRYPLSCVAAYVVHAAVLGLWFAMTPRVDSDELLRDAPEVAETQAPWESEALDALEEHGSRQMQQDRDGGLAALFLIAALLGTVLAGFYLVICARWNLGEVMFLGGKIDHRAAPKPQPGAWLIAPLKQSFNLGIALLIHYAMLGIFFQLLFPAANTLIDVLRIIG